MSSMNLSIHMPMEILPRETLITTISLVLWCRHSVIHMILSCKIASVGLKRCLWPMLLWYALFLIMCYPLGYGNLHFSKFIWQLLDCWEQNSKTLVTTVGWTSQIWSQIISNTWRQLIKIPKCWQHLLQNFSWKLHVEKKVFHITGELLFWYMNCCWWLYSYSGSVHICFIIITCLDWKRWEILKFFFVFSSSLFPK